MTAVVEDHQYSPLQEYGKGGFSFENCGRNERLLKLDSVKMPTAKKTGTTIVGLVYKDGVVLGADTRATAGSIVADKNCEKIHYIAPNIYCCGAGTSADTENVTAMVSSSLALQRLVLGKQSRTRAAQTLLKRHLFRYQGHVSAALILGGVDVTGPFLCTVAPHGSTDRQPFVTMGSGCLAAVSVFESEYKDNMEEQEAVALVQKAILRGIFEDLGSGGQVDVRVIRKDSSDYLRNCVCPNERAYRRPQGFTFPRGSLTVLKEEVQEIEKQA